MNKELIKVFKALADETRLEMVLDMMGKGEVSCQEYSKEFSLSQPTLSHHYKKLGDAGIIKVRKEGTNNFYSIDKDLLNRLGIDLKALKKNS